MSAKLAISRPKKGACGNTGSWRTFKPVVDREKCNSCGNCYRFCPDAAITTDFEIDYDFCKGCGICAEVCPKKAISMVREED
ncbi:4Fe-4S dicluster domain-containing protein [Methanoplanus sp. FWC-SCC4]|uniref:4Fe-4S dicluster domain-containing protein n=1 Tax=Methanochimaera problematica TaxID=2609417 RepID=A0AA97FEB3_9EURY|nr:4Fe-4S binding protein [Methanoplanus sp. FWC-SCC4]WOF16698.1 4Fe-4S dicluster domain-containing protein [Methanoplanus sp. FWC-SCC4]